MNYERVIQIPMNVFDIINKDAKITILLTMDYKDVIHLCSSWKDINNFCDIHSERIWKGMIKRDFYMIINNVQNYLKIYKDLMVAKDYYKRHKNRSIIELIENERENYFGVKWLIEVKKVDPSYDDNYAIRWASYFGHINVVILLLKQKDVDPSDLDNWAIRWASDNGHIDVVKLLLEDPRVNPSNNDNYAIKLASLNGHIDVVELLLEDSRVKNSLSEKEFENMIV